MRTVLYTIFCCFVFGLVSAQNITTAEYYFNDNDLGFGLNTSFSVNSSSQSESIDVSGLSNGFHDLHIRVFDQDGNEATGAWSHYDRVTFYIGSFLTGQDIVGARYRIDNGSNNTLGVSAPATTIAQSYQIGIGALPTGFHSLYIEAQDSDGTWSHYDRTIFYVADFPTGQDIVAYRYRIDDGTDISGTDTFNPSATSVSDNFTVDLTGLAEGFHSFYIETQAADGTWSLYDRQIIFINDFNDMPADIVAAEYFIDDEPVLGGGTSFDPFVVPLIVQTQSDISEGDHLFCVRVQNSEGTWSLYDCAIFTVDSSLGTNESLYKSISINPNPFKHTIELDFTRQVDFEWIKVFDITGKIVYQSTENLRVLNLENLEAGTYILSLRTETEKATFKIIKQ